MLSFVYELSAQPCLLGIQLRKCWATNQEIIDFAGMETFAKEHYKSFCEHKRNAPTADSEKKSLFFFLRCAKLSNCYVLVVFLRDNL